MCSFNEWKRVFQIPNLESNNKLFGKKFGSGDGSVAWKNKFLLCHLNMVLGQVNIPFQPNWLMALQKYTVNYTFSVNLLPAICDKVWEWWGESS